MRAVYFGRATGLTSGTAYLSPVTLGSQWNNTNFPITWRLAGQWARLRVTLDTAPGGVAVRTFTLLKNGAPTAISFTITGAATAGQEIAASIVSSPGDTFNVRQTDTGTPASSACTVSLEFDSAIAGSSGYAGVNQTSQTGATVTYTNPFAHNGWGGNPSVTPASSEGMVPIACTVNSYAITLQTAPGGVESRACVWIKNGTVQDGTAGTPDTRFTISGASVTGSATFALALVPGDWVTVRQTPSGAGVANSGQTALACDITATLNGAWILACINTTNASSNTNEFMPYPGDVAWTVTEADALMRGGVSSVVLSNLYVRYSGVCTRNCGLRKNGATSSLLAVAVASQTAQDLNPAHAQTIATADTFTQISIDVGGGFQRMVWAYQAFISPASITFFSPFLVGSP